MKWRLGLFGCLLSLLLSGILMSACRKEAIVPDKPAQPPPPGSSSSAGYWKSQSHKHLLLRKVMGNDTVYGSILMSTGSNPSLTLEAFSYQQVVIQEK